MQLHNLKIKKEYYDEVVKENKKFEIRKNDRDFQVNDLVKFIDADTLEEYMNLYQITYVLKDIPEYGLDKDYCIFSIKLVSIEDKEALNWDYMRDRFNNFNTTSPIPSTSLPKIEMIPCDDKNSCENNQTATLGTPASSDSTSSNLTTIPINEGVKLSETCNNCKIYKEFEDLGLLNNNEDDLPCSRCANDLINQ